MQKDKFLYSLMIMQKQKVVIEKMVTQKEIFYQYLMNERDRLENEVIKLRQALRYRSVDQADCLELALALERLNSFIAYSNHAIAIFKLSCPADYNTSIVNIDYTAYKKAAEDLRKSQKVSEKK